MTKIELNIALIPDSILDAKLVAASAAVAKACPAKTIVQLEPGEPRLSVAPHLTLYQLPTTVDKLGIASHRLRNIAAHQKLLELAAIGYAYNAHEGSFEAQRAMPRSLRDMQKEVIDALNPLRDGLLLERDPAGNSLRSMLENPKISAAAFQNISRTGYIECDELFRAHDTLNWLEPDTLFNPNNANLAPIQTLDGRYIKLGMFVLGPHGICGQRLEEYALAA